MAGFGTPTQRSPHSSTKPLWANSEGGYTFSVLFLEDGLAQAVLEALIKQPSTPLRVGDAQMSVSSLGLRQVNPSTVGQKLVGQTTLDLRFKTPTYFPVKNSHFKVIQPNLTLLFTNIANTLHIAKIESIPREDIKALRAKLGITGIDVRSTIIHDGKRVYPGFTGWVRITAKELDNTQLNILARLAEWAELLNVGGGRTAGFGVVEASKPRQTQPQPSTR
ncbi:MAG: CRISPR system precrRNA processing endoribonuclease RAMP protein Cas6 [Thermoprotei archaeon]